MVTTSKRREVVTFFKSRGHSERRACVLASLHRSTCQYEHRRTDDPELVAKLRDLASERPRYGYRRLHVLLRRDSRWKTVNRKRLYRIYKAAGLAVRRRSKKKARITRPAPPAPVSRPNERWSMDFVHDALADGRTFVTVRAST